MEGSGASGKVVSEAKNEKLGTTDLSLKQWNYYNAEANYI